LKIVPVGGGASVLNVAGSTCGRAGRRFRRMIFLTFLPSALVVIMVCSVVMGARSVDVEVVAAGSRAVSGFVGAGAVCAGGDCTSAIVCGVVAAARCEESRGPVWVMQLHSVNFP
jgi:pheromone shutdown protein TraB